MDSEWTGLIFVLGWPLFLLLLTYALGSLRERRHIRSIQVREEAYRAFPVMTFPGPPAGWQVSGAETVNGSVVVSLDYFKRFVASLRGLIGGRIKSYEPLLDRARREAVLRMIEDARSRGFDGVVNVRLETSRMASARGNGEGTAGIEMLAYGTGMVIAK